MNQNSFNAGVAAALFGMLILFAILIGDGARHSKEIIALQKEVAELKEAQLVQAKSQSVLAELQLDLVEKSMNRESDLTRAIWALIKRVSGLEDIVDHNLDLFRLFRPAPNAKEWNE
jgi:hypothetical protein